MKPLGWAPCELFKATPPCDEDVCVGLLTMVVKNTGPEEDGADDGELPCDREFPCDGELPCVEEPLLCPDGDTPELLDDGLGESLPTSTPLPLPMSTPLPLPTLLLPSLLSLLPEPLSTSPRAPSDRETPGSLVMLAGGRETCLSSFVGCTNPFSH
jgi:hypothetical protein